MDWESGMNRAKLLYIEWIKKKILLYSTRNYNQYPMINNNGKEYKKKEKSLFYTLEINTS